MKMSARRQSALEEIYKRQPIMIYNTRIDTKTINWLEKNQYIKISFMSSLATVTEKGVEYLNTTY